MLAVESPLLTTAPFMHRWVWGWEGRAQPLLQPVLGLENRAVSYCTVAAELLKGQQAQSPTLALSGGWRMG